MTTIHFAANFKNRPGHGTTSLCRMWAMRRGYCQTTTDRAAVTCKACAKKLGIAPAAEKKTGRESLTGTCPCCFGPFKVPRSGKDSSAAAVSLHGYERPGCGWIVGSCRGSHRAAFEVSCEATREWRAEIAEKHLPAAVDTLDRLESGDVESLPHTYRVGLEDRVVSVQVKRGAEEAEYGRIPSFASLLARRIRETADQIASMKATIADLDERIASWKPGSLK